MEKPTDLLTMMKNKAEAVQTIVGQCRSLAEAFHYAVDITNRKGGKSIAAPGFTNPDQSALQELCSRHGLDLFTGSLRSHLGHIHTGFTMADWGIAETATLIIDSTSEDLRLATMLSEIHVAVLPASRIRPNAESLENELAALQLAPPRYLAFISGASRTADIERVLTIGVHGPQELHLLIWENSQP